MILRIYKTFRKKWPFLEPLVLAGFGLVWFLLWSFLELSEEVMEGGTHTLDVAILMAMRDGSNPQNPWGPSWLAEMLRDISGLGGISILTLVTISAGFYLFMLQKRGAALYLIVSIIIGTLLSNALKYGFARPRPELVPHGSYTFTNSFPSGHSMMAALVYLSIGALLARSTQSAGLKIYFMATSIIITVLIGISRVYLGVHWPTDVVAGWVIGALCAVVFWLGEWGWQERIFSRSTPSSQG
ncbi:MAG: phosphoesterase [Micavibrio aeruginosavorus]|uniref:Phosphoesterase n=1 Tax=Micavibrio aeruginosavorus TaxID=349221 RepID=A0A2W5Q436_9BACT|nr:MAG: phosphoesterase [Micavibrio aeruginosavorus]